MVLQDGVLPDPKAEPPDQFIRNPVSVKSIAPFLASSPLFGQFYWR
jgi:hypothetical protein